MRWGRARYPGFGALKSKKPMDARNVYNHPRCIRRLASFVSNPGKAFVQVNSRSLNQLLNTLDVGLNALAVCEIGADWRLYVEPLETVICHFVLQGAGFLEFADQRIAIAAGAILIIPPGLRKSISGPGQILHEVSAADICSSYADGLLAFRARSAEPAIVLGCATITATCGGNLGLFDCLAEPLLAAVDGNDLFAAGFTALLNELAEPSIGATVVAECLMKQSLVFVLREQMSSGGRPELFDHFGDARIVRAAAAMIRSPESQHRTETLAELAGMSRSSFMTHFMQQYDKTPGEFLKGVRMHSAARLLLTSELPIKCLAAAVGYESRSHFSRAFKKAFGSDPSAYRHRMRGKSGVLRDARQ
jgi:AraC-like DNA-binding protein